MALVEEKLGRKLDRASPRRARAAPGRSIAPRISACIAQKQDGLELDRRRAAGRQDDRRRRCAGLPTIARDLGDGDIRLTVWQNLLISGVPTDKLEAARGGSRRSASRIEAKPIRAGLVACTGNVGCKFAASDTKRHAEEIARWCEARVELDTPGQHPSHRLPSFLRAALHRRHRPARLQGATSEDGDTVEGYHVLVGGGFGPDAALGREIYRDVKAEDAPQTVERMLKAYLAHRAVARGDASSPSRAATRSRR